jgi:hypothetical protein
VNDDGVGPTFEGLMFARLDAAKQGRYVVADGLSDPPRQTSGRSSR